MLARLLALLSVLFCALMTTLLIQRELGEQGGWTADSFDRVRRELIEAGQTSRLILFYQKQQIGAVLLQSAADQDRIGDYSLILRGRARLDGTAESNIEWDCQQLLGPDFAARELELSFTFAEFHLSWKANHRLEHHSVAMRENDATLFEAKGTAEQVRGQAWTFASQFLDADLRALLTQVMQHSSAVEQKESDIPVYSRRTRMLLQGQSVETTQVRIEFGPELHLIITYANTGQILALQAPFDAMATVANLDLL
ncbi:MAG: hypothetical protein ACFCU3_04120 [Verrucomicrobiales bacterium]